MSNLVERKDMIHMGVEIIVIAGVAYYFQRKTTSLSKSLEELASKIKDLEEVVVKQQQVIQNMGMHLNSLNEFMNSTQNRPQVKPKSSAEGRDTNVLKVHSKVKSKHATKSPVVHSSPPLKRPTAIPSKKSVVKFNELINSCTDTDSDNSESLDKEIEDELNELQ